MVVKPEHIDANGHMNVGYYNVIFDQALDKFFVPFDLDWSQRPSMSHENSASPFSGGDACGPMKSRVSVLQEPRKRLRTSWFLPGSV